jgi:hypothetical protein
MLFIGTGGFTYQAYAQKSNKEITSREKFNAKKWMPVNFSESPPSNHPTLSKYQV